MYTHSFNEWVNTTLHTLENVIHTHGFLVYIPHITKVDIMLRHNNYVLEGSHVLAEWITFLQTCYRFMHNYPFTNCGDDEDCCKTCMHRKRMYHATLKNLRLRLMRLGAL